MEKIFPSRHRRVENPSVFPYHDRRHFLRCLIFPLMSKIILNNECPSLLCQQENFKLNTIPSCIKKRIVNLNIIKINFSHCIYSPYNFRLLKKYSI